VGFVVELGGEFSMLVASRVRMPQPRDDLILALYKEGTPVTQIAERAGVCVKTVRNVARRAGVPARHPSQPERDAAIVRCYRAGDPVARIASDQGVTQPCVRRIAARAGVAPRQGWQRRYPLDEAAFDRPTRVGWWLIGLLAADGSIHAPENRISLCQSMKDVDVLHAFYQYVGCPERPLTMLNLSDEAKARQLPRGPAAEARVFSNRLVSALARHGVVPQKTASMQLGDEASRQAAVWLGMLDGDGSVGIYRGGRAPRLSFAGTETLMGQCERFWREQLEIDGARPSARPHAKGIWTFHLSYAKAEAAARVLLGASPTSMRRKRALLAQIAGRTA
jgi:lambda repressor-like predicted transcriptional regulator